MSSVRELARVVLDRRLTGELQHYRPFPPAAAAGLAAMAQRGSIRRLCHAVMLDGPANIDRVLVLSR